jgi:hypothetical protein
LDLCLYILIVALELEVKHSQFERLSSKKKGAELLRTAGVWKGVGTGNTAAKQCSPNGLEANVQDKWMGTLQTDQFKQVLGSLYVLDHSNSPMDDGSKPDIVLSTSQNSANYASVVSVFELKANLGITGCNKEQLPILGTAGEEALGQIVQRCSAIKLCQQRELVALILGDENNFVVGRIHFAPKADCPYRLELAPGIFHFDNDCMYKYFACLNATIDRDRSTDPTHHVMLPLLQCYLCCLPCALRTLHYLVTLTQSTMTTLSEFVAWSTVSLYVYHQIAR